jgi:glycosyltransferase involved in cell wall biosynthesis
LTAAGRKASLSLVGDGPKRGQLETLAREEGVAAQVRFHGNRTDVTDLMRRHHLMLHCTFSEGFPNAITEAMAVGLPVIASDIPPCREVLDNGSCGVLIPTRDPRAVSGAIVRLMDVPELRHQQAARARALVQRRYRIEDCAQRYTELLMPDSLK